MAKINVKFNDSGDETATTQQPTNESAIATNNAMQQAVKTAAVAVGKRILSNGASQIGNITGNYILQNQVNSAITIVGYAGAIAVGGWIGVATTVADIGIRAFNYDINRSKANAQANYIANIRGGILNDNSR